MISVFSDSGRSIKFIRTDRFIITVERDDFKAFGSEVVNQVNFILAFAE